MLDVPTYSWLSFYFTWFLLIRLLKRLLFWVDQRLVSFVTYNQSEVMSLYWHVFYKSVSYYKNQRLRCDMRCVGTCTTLPKLIHTFHGGIKMDKAASHWYVCDVVVFFYMIFKKNCPICQDYIKWFQYVFIINVFLCYFALDIVMEGIKMHFTTNRGVIV